LRHRLIVKALKSYNLMLVYGILFLQWNQSWKKAARVIMNAQTTLLASTENAETRATVALELSAQSEATGQSVGVHQGLKATHRSGVKKADASQMPSAHWTKLATRSNASTLATCPTLVQSTLSATQPTTGPSVGVHQG
jgi:hypothetical protein